MFFASRAPMLIAVAILLGASSTEAHEIAATHATADVAADRRSVSYRVLVSPGELAIALELGDSELTEAVLAQREMEALRYASEHIVIQNGELPCPLTPHQAIFIDGPLVELSWTAACPEPIEILVIEQQLFFDLDPSHTAVLQVTVPGHEPAVAELTDGHARFVWELGSPPPRFFAGFVKSGVLHIVLGFDHLAFLLALLVGITVERREHRWRSRSLRAALSDTLAIVTSFTVAHSLTLIAASLGWIRLPSMLVESAIALSIVYVAIENLWRPNASSRWLLTFGLGLIHGVGFASMLEVMLPPDDVLVPLLAFNLGVELGQLCIVLVVLPLLIACARRAPRAYHRWIVISGSLVLAVLGMIWLFERLSGTALLGF